MEIRPEQHSSRFDSFLAAVVDLCICGAIFAVPLVFGGRHPLGHLLLIIFSVGGAAAWALRRCFAPQATWRTSRIEPLLAAAVALLVLQITPLPENIIAHLQGGAARALQLSDGQSPAWTLISLAPQETKSALVSLCAYSLLFLLVVQRVQSLSDVERLLRWIAAAATAMAAFGLLQLLTSNGRFFWFAEHHLGNTAGAACGSFLNRNHFAHFLALGIGPVVWWALRTTMFDGSIKTDATGCSSASAGFSLVILAVLLSLSRGGAAAAAAALSVVLFFAYRNRAIRGRAIAAVGGAAFVAATALGILGHERVASRLDDWFSGSVESLDRDADRRTVWRATAAAAVDNLLLGIGAGGHRQVCPMYLDASGDAAHIERAGRYFSVNADNSPLEIFEETGLVGAALLGGVTAGAGVWCAWGMYRSRSRRLSSALAAVTASLTASLLHNLVDCGWYVPGCMSLTAVLLAAACRLFQLSADEERRHRQRVVLPRGFAIACTLVVVALGGWMLHGRVGEVAAERHWNEYRLACRASIARDAAGIVPEAENAATLKKMIDALEAAVAWDSGRVESHVQLAGMYLLLFERMQSESELNRMPLSAVREAASGFDSRRELEEWLNRAVGPHYKLLERARQHAQAAASLCPLEGAAYVYLSELCFLDGGDRRAAGRNYLRQALAVRPYDGAILLAAGSAAALEGEIDRAVEFWQRSFRAGRVHQRELVRRLAGHVYPQDAAAEIEFFLDNFRPELPILRLMDDIYSKGGDERPLLRLRREYAAAVSAAAARAPRGGEAAELWMEARLVRVKLGDNAAAVRCMEEALRSDPNSYKAHYRLALAKLEERDVVEARRHLQWCLARNPQDMNARNKFEEMLRLEATTRGRVETRKF